MGGSAENNRWFGEADRDVDGSALVSPFPGAHLLKCLVVPFRKIRDHLKAKEGEKVAFVLRGDDVILRMMRGNILDLKGGVKPPKRSQNFEDIRKSVKKVMSRRIAREA